MEERKRGGIWSFAFFCFVYDFLGLLSNGKINSTKQSRISLSLGNMFDLAVCITQIGFLNF